MKINRHGAAFARILTTLTLAVGAVLSSCIKDNVTTGTPGEKPRPGISTVLSFNPQLKGHGNSTRASYQDFGGMDDFDPTNSGGNTGSPADRAISSFRVLVYDDQGALVKMGDRYWNFLIDGAEAQTTPFSITVATGEYDFVFIANEQTLSDELGTEGTSNSNIATLAGLEALAVRWTNSTVAAQIAATDIHRTLDIPMISYFPSVDVGLNNSVSYNDPYDSSKPVAYPTPTEKNWPVKMRRDAIRLSFGISMGKGEYKAWSDYHRVMGENPVLFIENLRSSGSLWDKPELHNDASARITDRVEISADGTKPGLLTINPDGSARIFIDRLIYPEVRFSGSVSKNDAAAKAKGLRAYMFFDYGREAEEKEIFVHAPDPETSSLGYSLPRNTWLWVNANVASEVDYVTEVLPWGVAGLAESEFMQYNIETDRSGFLFNSAASEQVVEVFTDHPTGWILAEGPDSPAYQTPDWITVVETSGPADATTPVTVEVEENDTDQIRTGHFTLNAGNIYKVITVTQLPGSGMEDTPPPANVMMFVGAFWKANQYGERLIRIPRPEAVKIDNVNY
ncbi:MAG: hypothetical protein LBU97_04620, partial [Alistipes sp.]|nr:hypothetical protein [Alistipes sp.]